MDEQCFALKRLPKLGPWVDEVLLWQRVTVLNRKHETWRTVCLRALAKGDLVACRVCRALPGVQWKTEDWWVCGLHGGETGRGVEN